MPLREAADKASPAVEVAEADLAIAVTRPGPTFRVNVEFGSDVPMQMVVGVMDACNALGLPDVVLDNGGESRKVSPWEMRPIASTGAVVALAVVK